MARLVHARLVPGHSMRWREIVLVVLLGCVALLAHAPNMFDYPAFTLDDDEGIYAAQAWAALREQRLTPYAYTYDHAPGGWLQLAAWMALLGGPHASGGAIDTGRALMLLLHLAMVALLYYLARRAGCGPPLAAAATLLFSLSPLAIFYQRMVLLDTIMLFWTLLGLAALLTPPVRPLRLGMSGLCFGVALLTKETALFLLPAALLLVLTERQRASTRTSLLAWGAPLCGVAALYPLYALSQGQLLPPDGNLLALIAGGAAGSCDISLASALSWQISRDGGGLLSFDNEFWHYLSTDWVVRDRLLWVCGVVATIVNGLRGIRDRRLAGFALLGGLPLFYLAHGGIVFAYYVLLAIPFLCLNIALVLQRLVPRVRSDRTARWVAGLTVLVVAWHWQFGALASLYLEHPARPGREAVAWMKANLPGEARIVGRADMWADMHEAGPSGPAFVDYHNHWKLAQDPAVRYGIFADNWENIDYLVLSPGLVEDFIGLGETTAFEALQRATLVARWASPGGRGDLHRRQSVEIWMVERSRDATAVEVGYDAHERRRSEPSCLSPY